MAAATRTDADDRPGAVGRIVRVGLGLLMLAAVAPHFLAGDWRFILASLGVALGLVGLYALVHVLVSSRFRGVSRSLGSVAALAPLVLVYVLGFGDGPIFGQGEGQLGALTFLAGSLILAGWHADPGCEVMSAPNALFGRRAHLTCLFLLPIDRLERRLGKSRGQ